MNEQEMKKANPHLIHLIGKSIPELRKMFPYATYCDSPTCEFNDLDHAISMEHQHEVKNAEKRGIIRVMYKMKSAEDSERTFHWFNNKEWIELKQ